MPPLVPPILPFSLPSSFLSVGERGVGGRVGALGGLRAGRGPRPWALGHSLLAVHRQGAAQRLALVIHADQVALPPGSGPETLVSR